MSRNVAVIVTGDRHATDNGIDRDWLSVVDHALLETFVGADVAVVIHGACGQDIKDGRVVGSMKGIDAIANQIAHDYEWNHLPMPANWTKYGRKAGPIRNANMLIALTALEATGYDIRILAFHNDLGQSRGTLDMAQRGRRADTPVSLYNQQGERSELYVARPVQQLAVGV